MGKLEEKKTWLYNLLLTLLILTPTFYSFILLFSLNSNSFISLYPLLYHNYFISMDSESEIIHQEMNHHQLKKKMNFGWFVLLPLWIEMELVWGCNMVKTFLYSRWKSHFRSSVWQLKLAYKLEQ